jgi:hypothetical protein
VELVALSAGENLLAVCKRIVKERKVIESHSTSVTVATASIATADCSSATSTFIESVGTARGNLKEFSFSDKIATSFHKTLLHVVAK